MHQQGFKVVSVGVLAVLAAALGGSLVPDSSLAVSESARGNPPAVSRASTAPVVRAAGQFQGSVRGRVRLMNRRGTAPARAVSVEDVLVFYAPKEGIIEEGIAGTRRVGAERTDRATAAQASASFEMATINKSYEPRVLAVPVGAKVNFPNHDRVLHNVFSVSGRNRFDLELLGPGKSRAKTFSEPGLVRVFCNVHRDMVGFVWVLNTPYSARPDGSGRFHLAGLPPGVGTLTVWHERAKPSTFEIEAAVETAERDIELRITRPRLPSHARKDGTAYRKRSRY